MFPIKATLTIASLLVFVLSTETFADNRSLQIQPLVYTRLRFDYGALFLLRDYQKELTIDEELRTIDDKLENGQKITHKYYINIDHNASDLEEDDLVIASLNGVYKSRIIQHNVLEYDDPDDRKRAGDPQKVNTARCMRELDYLMQAQAKLLKEKGRGRAPNAELLNFFGAYATESPNYLQGNYYWVGDSRQCAMRHVFDLNPPNAPQSVPKVISFSGRYCVASIRSPTWDKKVQSKANQLSRTYFKYPGQDADYKRFFRFQVGICLPESCDSSIVDTRANDIRKLVIHKLKEPFTSYNLSHLFCLPDDSSELRQADLSGRILLQLSAVWFIVILLASIADYYDLVGLKETQKRKQQEQEHTEKSLIQHLVLAMSLIESIRKLVKSSSGGETSSKSSRPKLKNQQRDQSDKLQDNKTQAKSDNFKETSLQDLLFFNAMKVAVMPLIIFAHVAQMIHQVCRTPLNNDTASKIFFHLATSTTFLVDWYFCITGFVVTYAMFSTNFVNTSTRGQLLYSIFHRYWRLAPTYILFFWFCRSLSKLTGSGPLWDYGTGSFGARAICQRESWWTPITLTSNLKALHESCIMPGWYISNDMQFYLITPILLILLTKSPRLGWLTMLGIIGASVSARFTRYLYDPRARPLDLLKPRYDVVARNNWDMHPTYLYPQYRISSYLVGILAGHYCYMVRSGKWNSIFFNQESNSKSARSSNLWLKLIACMGLAIVTYMNITTWPMYELFPQHLEYQVRFYSALFYSGGHTITSIGVAFLSMSFLFGHWPRLRKIMEHPIWSYLSRINYFIYLYQMEAIAWMLGQYQQLPDSTGLDVLQAYMFILPLIYWIALLATLLLGTPLASLETELRKYFGRCKRKAQMEDVPNDRKSKSS